MLLYIEQMELGFLGCLFAIMTSRNLLGHECHDRRDEQWVKTADDETHLLCTSNVVMHGLQTF